jgi:hypothetical protein
VYGRDGFPREIPGEFFLAGSRSTMTPSEWMCMSMTTMAMTQTGYTTTTHHHTPHIQKKDGGTS